MAGKKRVSHKGIRARKKNYTRKTNSERKKTHKKQSTPIRRTKTKKSSNTFFQRKIKPLLRKILKYLIQGLIAAHFFLVFWVLVFCIFISYINPPITALMLYRKQHTNYKIRKIRFVKFKYIPANMHKMVRYAEDIHFYVHPGIDLEGIRHAFVMNLRLGRRAYGGSTITQQLARTLFLVPRKSFLRKYVEMLIALEMDLIMSKDRIFELYFNYAEWGRGIFGVQNASYYYYGRSIWKITDDEKIRLITILSSPLKYSPYKFGRKTILYKRYNFLKKHFLPKEEVNTNAIDTLD